jgi:fibronectin-binding autotransporter adhesin
MKSTRILSSSVATLLALVAARQVHGQAISLSGAGTYLQNFDGLIGGTNWVNNTTIPGWYAQTDTTPNPLPIAASDGSTTIRGLLSLGTSGGADRAFGWSPTTTNYGMTLMGVVFQNTSAGVLNLGQLQYTGELWRTQATANNIDGFQFFYQISSAPVTDLGPFTVDNGGTYATNAGRTDPGWIRLTGLDYATSSAAADAQQNPALATNVIQNMGLTLQPNEYITLRWRNPNDTAGDAAMGIDDFSLNYFISGAGANLIYNPAHTVGGAPNGVLEVSGAQYWLNGANPSGFAAFDSVTFNANVTANISVPANVSVDTMTVSATSGTYTIGGTGAISGNLVKSGAGNLILTSPNAFTSITLNDGGTLVAQSANAITANSLTLGNGGTLDLTGDSSINGAVSGAGPLTKIGTGQLTLGGAQPNTYTGDTIVNQGTLILGKIAGTVAIPGNLAVGPGATVRYINNNTGDQIADSATIVISGGNFGDLAAGNPTNPGAPETVAEVVMSGGQFSTGRATFTASNNFTVTGGGVVTAHRGGTLAVGNTLTVDGTLNMHGGSTTGGQESRVTTGAGGLVLANATVGMNTGATGTVVTTSVGSIVVLGGNLVSTGTSVFVRQNATVPEPKADIDLQGVDRTFSVTGSLRIGSLAAPVLIQNGGVVKEGSGVLTLGGNQIYVQPTTINAGKLVVDGSLASSTVTVAGGTTLGGAGSVSGAVTVNHQGNIEAGIDRQGVLNVGSLTFGSTPTDTASITVSRNATPATLAVLNPNGLVANGAAGSVAINLAGDTPALGQHLLIDYDGTIGGAGGFGAFTLGTKPNRMDATLVNDLATTAVMLEVTSVDQPVWSGALSSEWSTATLSNPKNWVLNSNNAVGTDFLTNDNVLFTESAPNKVVDVSVADVTVASVRFNATSNYTLNGSKAIAGDGSLIKEGSGDLIINNTNSFTGGVFIEGGFIRTASVANAGVNSPLGAGNLISLNNGGIELTGPTSTTNRAINIGAAGGGFMLNGALTTTGGVTGNGSFFVTGPGKLILAGASPTFNGNLQIQAGTVQYTGATIGGNNVTVTGDGGTLENNDTAEAVFSDAATILRTLSVGAGGLTVNVLNATGAILFDRPEGIAGTGTITKTGPGIMRPHVDNLALASNWVLNEGVLEVGTLAALGGGSVTVNNGLLASRNVPVQNAVTLNGGSIGTRSGDLADFQGPMNILGPAQASLLSYTTPANSQTITLSGVVSGNANFSITGNNPQTNGGNKSLVLTNTGNTYSGTFLVTPGQALTAQPLTTGSTLGGATVSLDSASLIVRDNGSASDSQITYSNPVIVTGSGTSTIDVNRAAAGTFTGNTVRLGALSIGAQTLNVTGGNSYKASFTGTATLTAAPTFQPTTADLIMEGDMSGSFGFTKAGDGRMVIAGTTTFAGPVTVQAGTLAVNGSTSAGSDIAVVGGTLAGSGTIGGNVNLTGGILTAGDGVGVLTINGNLTAAGGSLISVQLSHGAGVDPVPGTDYDLIRVAPAAGSTVTLSGAGLTLTVGTGIQEDDLFFLLLNEGTDAINGTFAGLADDAIFASGGQVFQISYNADTVSGSFNLAGGNDIALMAIPEPASLILMGGGLILLSSRRRRA